MGLYTMTTSEVLEILFNPTADELGFELDYASFTVNGVTYGRLPVIPDAEQIGLGTYPIFNEAYRPILNGKIIDNYFNREIGVETIDEWRLVMRRKMDQIMPYFNQLYESQNIDFDPLITMRIESKSTSETTANESALALAESSSDSTSASRAVSSETPQNALSGNADYATSAADSNGSTGVTASNSQDSNSSSNTENESENIVSGMQGIASELIIRYRNSLINVDTMVINELDDCFMLILNNADSYFKQGWFN